MFFIPSALLFAELGTAFPEEGGPYVWTRLAFGRLAGAVNNFLYWVTNPVWLGGTLAVAGRDDVRDLLHGGDASAHRRSTSSPCCSSGSACWRRSCRSDVGKWIPTVGAWSRFLLLGFFTLSVMIYALKHGVHGFGAGGFKPSYIGFVGLVPILLFNFVGFELPSSAGDEMTDPQKDVPFAIFRARDPVDRALRRSRSWRSCSSCRVAGHQPGRLHRRDQVGLHRLRRHVGAGGAELTGRRAGAGRHRGGRCSSSLCCRRASPGSWAPTAPWPCPATTAQRPAVLGVISERFGTPVRVNIFSGILSTIVLVMAHQITGVERNDCSPPC